MNFEGEISIRELYGLQYIYERSYGRLIDFTTDAEDELVYRQNETMIGGIEEEFHSLVATFQNCRWCFLIVDFSPHIDTNFFFAYMLPERFYEYT